MTVPSRPKRILSSYFTEKSHQKYFFYLACLAYVLLATIVVLLEPFISIPCDTEESNQPSQLVFKNPLFHYTPCLELRYPHLLFLTRLECKKGRSLLAAVFLGSLIGYERRSSDRPAGIRTMALVSLGSALFTINSTFAFLGGPMVSSCCCEDMIGAFICVNSCSLRLLRQHNNCVQNIWQNSQYLNVHFHK